MGAYLSFLCVPAEEEMRQAADKLGELFIT